MMYLPNWNRPKAWKKSTQVPDIISTIMMNYKESFRIVTVSFLISCIFAFAANAAYGQCGADGNQPCSPAPTSNFPSKSSKGNPTKKAPRSKSSIKIAAPQGESRIGKTYALVIMENANLRESATIYSSSIREVALNEKLPLTEEEPVGPWYKVFDSKTKSAGWLHGNTIEIVYRREKSRNNPAPSEAVTKTQIKICAADVEKRVAGASEIYKIYIENGEKQAALEQLNVMKNAVLQYRRCLSTGLRLQTITEAEKAVFLEGLEKTKGSLEIIENSRKNLIQSPE